MGFDKFSFDKFSFDKQAWLESFVSIESPATKKLTERVIRRTIRNEVKKEIGLEDPRNSAPPAGTVLAKPIAPSSLPSGHAEVQALPEVDLTKSAAYQGFSEKVAKFVDKHYC